jgi:hypothetical protein
MGPEERSSHLKSAVFREVPVFMGTEDSVPYQHYIEQVKG